MSIWIGSGCSPAPVCICVTVCEGITSLQSLSQPALLMNVDGFIWTIQLHTECMCITTAVETLWSLPTCSADVFLNAVYVLQVQLHVLCEFSTI